MSNITLVKGKVKYPAREPKDYGNGERINVVVTASGEDIKVWGRPDEPLAALRKGQDVQLIHDGKNYKLVETNQPKPELSTSNQETSKPPQLWNDDEKKAIASVVNQQADLLAYCLQIAKAKFTETGLVESEESMRCLATTLFIQAVRKP